MTTDRMIEAVCLGQKGRGLSLNPSPIVGVQRCELVSEPVGVAFYGTKVVAS
jgi:hypothetical protein